MKIYTLKSLVFLLIILFTVCDRTNAQDTPSQNGQANASTDSDLVLYKPPMRGAPKLRVGGGVRGGSFETPVLQVIAPQQIGLTTLEQPVLYWHLDKAANYALEMTVMEAGKMSPLLLEKHDGPINPGLHSFRVTGQNIRLETGKEYEWFVALIIDPEQRSKDIIAGGGIMRVSVPTGLQKSLDTAPSHESGGIYAQAGLWYDAINAMVAGQGNSSDKLALNDQFAGILQQEEIRMVTLAAVERIAP